MLFKTNKLFIGTVCCFAAEICNEEKYDNYKKSIYSLIAEWAHATAFGLFVSLQFIDHSPWKDEPIFYDLCYGARAR